MGVFNTTFLEIKVFVVIIILTAQTTFAESFISPPAHASGPFDRFSSQMLSTMQKFEDGTVSQSLFMDDISYERMTTTYTYFMGNQTSDGGEVDFSNLIMDAHFAGRLHKYLLISLNYFVTFLSTEGVITDLIMPHIFNAGPVLTSKFGSVGFFFGMEHISAADDAMLNYEETVFAWRIIPKINTRDYPIIGYVLERLEGYLGMKKADVDSYSMNFLSRGFNLGKIDVKTISFFYKNMPYNWMINNKIYGLQIGIEDFIIEGGYQEFYKPETQMLNFPSNIRINLNYKNGPFGKLIYTYDEFSVGIEMSPTYFPMPRITATLGGDYGFIKGGAFAHFFYSPEHWEFGIGLKLELLDIGSL